MIGATTDLIRGVVVESSIVNLPVLVEVPGDFESIKPAQHTSLLACKTVFQQQNQNKQNKYNKTNTTLI